MRILFINPNTSQSFTDKIQRIAEQYAAPGTEVVAKSAASGPRSIESIYDELLSSPGTLQVAIEEIDKFDAFVIACFSDHPTVYALREITEKPVLGIAEAAVYLACMIGHRFSIVTTNDEWEPLRWDMVVHYGLKSRCASVRTTGLPVLALEEAGEEGTRKLIGEAARKAVEGDHAEVIVLGCAGMAGMDKELEKELGVPVIDGVVAALKFLEGMVGYGIHTSKRRAYARPGRKELVGMMEVFERAYRK